MLWDSTFNTFNYFPIYEGRTWYGSDHKTTILLNTILRDHSYRCPVVYDEANQIFKPKNIGQFSDSIELPSNMQFYTTQCHVELSDGTLVAEFPVTVQNYSPIHRNTWWRYWTIQITGASRNNNPYITSNVLPHYPMVSSSKIWVGLNYCYTDYERRSYTFLHCGGTRYEVGKPVQGTYFFYIPLNVIVNQFGSYNTDEYTIVKNDTYFIYGGHDDYEGGYDAFALDNCPKDYYLLWDNSYGAFSWGMSGKTILTETADNVVMTNIMDAETNLWNRTQYGWTLNTGILNEDERAFVTTLIEAQNVWLYDVKLDKVWNVKCDTSSLRAQSNAKMDNMQISVKEIINHIY